MLTVSRSFKKFSMWALLVSAIVFLYPSLVYASVTYSNYVDPLDAGSGARVLGMGRAFVAAADDVNSIFFNPAGLAFTKDWGVASGFSTAIQDTSNANIGAYFSNGNDEGFGLGFVGSATGNPMTAVPTRELATGRVLPIISTKSSFSSSVAILAYGTNVGKYLDVPFLKNASVGLSLKGFFQLIESQDENFKGNGFDIDLGMIYPLNRWLKFGLYGQNVLGKDSGGKLAWTTGDEEPIPSDYKAGISAKLMGNGGLLRSAHDLFFNFEVEQSYYDNNLPLLTHAGLEWHALDYLVLRCGLDQILLSSPAANYSAESDFTAGVGYNYGDFGIDYAYHTNGEDIANVMHYFSVSYAFGSEAERQAAAEVQPSAEVEAAPSAEVSPTPEAETAQSSSLETMSASGEYLSIESPADRSIVYTDAAPVTCNITDYKVSRVEINGLPALITGEGQRKAVETVKVPPAGKFMLRIKCFDVTGLLLKEYDIKLMRLPVFSDVPDYFWAKDKIIVLSALNMLNGYPNGTFNPDKPITRAEMTSILVKTSGYITPEAEASSFIDVDKNSWENFYVNKGVEMGFIAGYAGNEFKPTKEISRADGIVIISRFAGLKIPEKITKAPYSDVPVDNWAARTMSAAKDAGLLDYIKDKSLEPNKPMTRAEAAAILSQTGFVKAKSAGFLNWDVGF